MHAPLATPPSGRAGIVKRRSAATLLALPFLLIACASEEALPPPSAENPRLSSDGRLTGVEGVGRENWENVDHDLRRGVFWHRFNLQLVARCRELFPEHADWLDELATLLRFATGIAVTRGIEVERHRLAAAGHDAERGIVALQAMRDAEMDVEGIVGGWLEQVVPGDVERHDALVTGCGLIFERKHLRELIETAALPLRIYYDRLASEYPTLYAATPDLPAITRRLRKLSPDGPERAELRRASAVRCT